MKDKNKTKEQLINELAEMRQREGKYRTLVEVASRVGEGICVLQADGEPGGVVVFANDAVARMFGYSKKELIGMPVVNFVSPDSLSTLFESFGRKVKGEKVGYTQITTLRKDGTRITVEANMEAVTYQGKLSMVAYVRDTTERKRIEREKEEIQEELARSEEKYRSVFEHAGLAIVVYDTNEIVQLWNNETERITGYKAEEMVGREIPKISLGTPEQRREVLRQVQEKGYIESYETSVIRKDGTRVPVEVTLAALRDSEGKITAFTFICKDITERKRLKQEREEALGNLAEVEKMAVIGELASMVGHELRNPLGVINNAIYYLKMKLGEEDGKVKRYLELIEEEVATSNRIISDILDFGRPKQPSIHPTNINSVVKRILEKYAMTPKVKVITKLGKGLPQIAADADQIQQVFLNLISNAVQAMPDGGELFIRTTWGDDFVKAEFKDTGAGVPPENLEKIFNPLFTTKAKGTGLGLSICKSIVEAHHGRIEVSNQSGKGATFTVTLPSRPTRGEKQD